MRNMYMAFASINKPLADLYDNICTFEAKVHHKEHITPPKTNFNQIKLREPILSDISLDLVSSLYEKILILEEKYLSHPSVHQDWNKENYLSVKILLERCFVVAAFPLQNPNDPIKFLNEVIDRISKSLTILENKAAADAVSKESPYMKYSPKGCLDFVDIAKSILKISKSDPFFKRVKSETQVLVAQISPKDPSFHTKQIIKLFRDLVSQCDSKIKESVGYQLWIVLLNNFHSQAGVQYYFEMNSAKSSGHVVKELLQIFPDKELFVVSLILKNCPILFQYSCKNPDDEKILYDYLESFGDESEAIQTVRGMARLFASICLPPNRNTSVSLILSIKFLLVIIHGLMNKVIPIYSAEAITGILEVAGLHLKEIYNNLFTRTLKSIVMKIEQDPELSDGPSESLLLITIRDLMRT